MTVCDNIYYLQFSSFFFSDTDTDTDTDTDDDDDDGYTHGTTSRCR